MATVNSSQAGNWNSTSTWGGAAIPTAGDTVNITHVVTYNITDDTNTITTININAGGELKWLGGSTLILRFTNMVINGGKLTGRSGTFLRCLGGITVNNTKNSIIDMKGSIPNHQAKLTADVTIGRTEIEVNDMGFGEGDYISVYNYDTIKSWNVQDYEAFIVNSTFDNTVYLRRFVGPRFTLARDTIINDKAFYVGDNVSNNLIQPSSSDFITQNFAYWTFTRCAYAYANPYVAASWYVSNAGAAFANDIVDAPDGTLTSAGGSRSGQRLTFTTGLSGYDMYKNYGYVYSGVSYTVSMWVKLGTATNLCLVVNNSIVWNTVGGKEFTTAGDGINTTTWTKISYIFTGPASNTVNIHLGDNAQTSPINLSTTQTAGTVFVWGLTLYETANPNMMRLVSNSGPNTFLINPPSIGLNINSRVKIKFKAKAPVTTEKPTIINSHFTDIVLVKQPSLTTAWQDYEFLGTLISGSVTPYIYLTTGSVASGTVVDIKDIEVYELTNNIAQTFNVGDKFVLTASNLRTYSYTVSSVDIYNQIIYTTQQIHGVNYIGDVAYMSGIEKAHLTDDVVYKMSSSVLIGRKGDMFITVSKAAGFVVNDVISIGGNVYVGVEEKIISSITTGATSDTINLTTPLAYDHFKGGQVVKINRDCIFHGNTADVAPTAGGYVTVADGITYREVNFENTEFRYFGNINSILWYGVALRGNCTKFRVNVTGITVTPAVDATYTASGYTFTVVSTNITGGTGTIYLSTGSVPIYLVGAITFTKSGGTGDTTFTSSSYLGVTDGLLNVSGRGAYFNASYINGWLMIYSAYHKHLINNVVSKGGGSIGGYSTCNISYIAGNINLGSTYGIYSYGGLAIPVEYNLAEATANYGYYPNTIIYGYNQYSKVNGLPLNRIWYNRMNFCASGVYNGSAGPTYNVEKLLSNNSVSRSLYNETSNYGGSLVNNLLIEQGLIYMNPASTAYFRADTSMILNQYFIVNNYNFNKYMKFVSCHSGFMITDYAIRISNNYSWKLYPKVNSAESSMGFFAIVQLNAGSVVKIGAFVRKDHATNITTKLEILDEMYTTLASTTLTSINTWEWKTTLYTATKNQNLIIKIGCYGLNSQFMWIDSPTIYIDNGVWNGGVLQNFWTQADPMATAQGTRLTKTIRFK